MDKLFDENDPELWARLGRAPNANMDMGKGLEYFKLNEFWFPEPRGYTQLESATGFDGGFGDDTYAKWRILLAAWEEEAITTFRDWDRRSDMDTVSEARQSAKRFGMNGPYQRDIVRSWKSFSWRNGNSTELKAELGAWAPETRAGFSDFVQIDTLKQSGVRVQCVALTKALSASLTHHTSVHVAEQVPTSSSQLVIWPESQIVGSELMWRWLGAIFSWRHCRMEALTSASPQTLSVVNGMAMPLIRRWAQLVREAGAGTLEMPPNLQPKSEPEKARGPFSFLDDLDLKPNPTTKKDDGIDL